MTILPEYYEDVTTVTAVMYKYNLAFHAMFGSTVWYETVISISVHSDLKDPVKSHNL